MSVNVSRHDDGAIVVITINRPEVRNAVDRDTAEQLAAAFRRFEADEHAKVAILTGAGKSFCAGADLAAVAEGGPRMNQLEPDGDGPMGPTRMRLSKPVIAAIRGYAVAGGLELAIWCDMRVAEEDATLGVFCRRFGVPLIDGGSVRLPRLIGHGRAMDLILTGRAVGAPEALTMGLVNRVVPTGRALDEAVQLARDLASLPQLCMRNDMASAREQWGLGEDAALAQEFRTGTRSLLEASSGAARFLQGAGRAGAAVAERRPASPQQRHHHAQPEHEAAIRAVVFDVGGVLVDSPLHIIGRYEQELGLSPRSLGAVIAQAGDSGAFARLERGELTVQEFASPFEAECRAAGLHGVDASALLHRMCADLRPRPHMLEALEALRDAGITTAALTNNFLFERSAEPRASDPSGALLGPVAPLLDHVFESCRLRMRKPEPRIYEHALRVLGVRADETVFLDDLGVNLKAAATLGMRTIKVAAGRDGSRQAVAELERVTRVGLLGHVLRRAVARL